MVTDSLVTTALALIFAGINIGLFLFFKTENFAKEYEEKNEKIASKLIQEFQLEVTQWMAKVNASSPSTAYGALLSDLQQVAKMASFYERWTKQITTGKALLHKTAGFVFISCILTAPSLIAFASDSAQMQFLGLFGSASGFVFGWFAFTSINEYFGLVRRIDAKSDNLKLGKPIIDKAEL